MIDFARGSAFGRTQHCVETPEEWVRVGSVEQTLSAEPMPEAIATTLRAEPDSMAIAIRRVYRLTDAQLVEVAFNLHPADRFTYSVTLQRRG